MGQLRSWTLCCVWDPSLPLLSPLDKFWLRQLHRGEAISLRCKVFLLLLLCFALMLSQAPLRQPQRAVSIAQLHVSHGLPSCRRPALLGSRCPLAGVPLQRCGCAPRRVARLRAAVAAASATEPEHEVHICAAPLHSIRRASRCWLTVRCSADYYTLSDDGWRWLRTPSGIRGSWRVCRRRWPRRPRLRCSLARQ